MTSPSPTERDPVCGMNVNPATAKHVHEHAEKNYYFCCAGCADKFRSNPQTYLNKPSSGLVTLGMPSTPHAQPANHPAAAEVQGPSSAVESGKPKAGSPISYVCPMCSEVRETKPGPCPSCGMALEPDVPLASTRTE